MKDKPRCYITHSQIVAGPCPWCESYVRDGRLAAPADGAKEVRWNWTALEDGLRDDDPEVRSHTMLNVSHAAAPVDKLLPLLSLALADTDPDVRSSAELGWPGRNLNEQQAVWLEEQAKNEQFALAARSMLLEYYFAKRKPAGWAARLGHIYWLIEHHPERRIAGCPDAYILKREDAAAYERGKELWLQQCVSQEASATVLGNAARYFLLNDPDIAEKLLRSAQTREPDNPAWHEALAQLFTLAANHGPTARRSERARQCLVELEMAEQLRAFHSAQPADEESRELGLLSRVHTLPNRARAALAAGEFELARQLAEECLALATSGQLDEFPRNDGNAIHYGHLVLGRVALERGDLEGAKRHLIESGKTEGSPNLGSFGPNMSLAKQLLEQGERAIVLEYLDLCGAFWERGSDRLADWKEAIADGRTPLFGANLNY